MRTLAQKQRSPFYVFNNHSDADAAIESLHRAGFDVKKLSLIGKGYHSEERPVEIHTAGDRIKEWGTRGAFWGGIGGLLVAPVVFLLPGLGLVALAGPLATALTGALEGAAVVGGVSALAAALTRHGVENEDVIEYEAALKADNYVLLVHGDLDDAAKARALLTGTRMQETAQARTGHVDSVAEKHHAAASDSGGAASRSIAPGHRLNLFATRQTGAQQTGNLTVR